MRDDMFCAAGCLWGNKGGYCEAFSTSNRFCEICKHCKHKWPTPAQFRKEYGREAPEHIPVWWLNGLSRDWNLRDSTPDWLDNCVIACTPYGRPPDGYRPEED